MQQTPVTGAKATVPAVDDLDRAILAILRRNARESFVHIADALRTSEGTVRARVKRLTDEGVIRRFTIRTAGANVKAMVEIKVRTNVSTSEISDAVAAWDGIDQVVEVSGDYDIVVFADVDSTARLNEIIERIRGFPNVESTRSRIILKDL